jgi:hypothetical protein
LTFTSILPCECCDGPNYGGPNTGAAFATGIRNAQPRRQDSII